MATEAQRAQEQYELYSYCRHEGGHERYLADVEVAKRYYASRQWSDEDERKRTQEGRLSFVVNETFRTINAVRGELNQLVSDVRYDPVNGDPEVARILNRLSEHTDRQNKLFMHDDAVLLDGLLGGRGFYRLRVQFDENMQGWVELKRQRPENVVLDHNLTSPDPSDWDRIFTTEVVSVADLENMYGKHAVEGLGEMPYSDWLDHEDRTLAESLGYRQAGDSDPETRAFRRHRLINHQWREYKYKDCFVDPVTGDIAEIPENWSREKVAAAIRQFNLATMRRKIKTIRWRVTCNGRVLHDEDSPYNYFDIVPYLPWFVDGMALSLFNVIKGGQDLLNYTVSEETHILGTTSHSGWKVKAGSLQNMTERELEKKGARSGLVLILDDPKDAERITPGQPASGYQQFGDRARNWINELASVSPSMLGAASEYANGKNVSSNLSRAPINLHTPLAAFQFTKQLLAERKLDLFQNYYTEERIMRIAPRGFGDAEEIAINTPDPATGQILYDITMGRYAVRLLPVGSRAAADEFAFDELVKLKELGLNVPASLFVTYGSLAAKSEAMEQLLEANGGELSPEEARANELELQRMELENADMQAGLDQKASQAELNRARALERMRFSEFDPRPHKAQLDQARLASEHSRDLRRIETQHDRDLRANATKIAELAMSATPDEQEQVPDEQPTQQPR